MCPGLYTSTELMKLAFQRSPAAEKAAAGTGPGHYRADKVMKATEDLLKDIHSNVHVAVCLSEDRQELCRLCKLVPQLLQGKVCVQWYTEWDEADCAEVSVHLWPLL